MMANRTMWTGSASDLLSLCAESARNEISTGGAWAKNPRALSGRLRRAQTFLRMMGIEITFSREGRSGTRMIRVSTNGEDTVSNVSTVSVLDQTIRPMLARSADDADGTDANLAFVSAKFVTRPNQPCSTETARG
jgi:hypothetical protein